MQGRCRISLSRDTTTGRHLVVDRQTNTTCPEWISEHTRMLTMNGPGSRHNEGEVKKCSTQARATIVLLLHRQYIRFQLLPHKNNPDRLPNRTNDEDSNIKANRTSSNHHTNSNNRHNNNHHTNHHTSNLSNHTSRRNSVDNTLPTTHNLSHPAQSNNTDARNQKHKAGKSNNCRDFDRTCSTNHGTNRTRRSHQRSSSTTHSRRSNSRVLSNRRISRIPIPITTTRCLMLMTRPRWTTTREETSGAMMTGFSRKRCSTWIRSAIISLTRTCRIRINTTRTKHSWRRRRECGGWSRKRRPDSCRNSKDNSRDSRNAHSSRDSRSLNDSRHSNNLDRTLRLIRAQIESKIRCRLSNTTTPKYNSSRQTQQSKFHTAWRQTYRWHITSG
ncbi:hypothetical protein BLNAU_17308 [Blattamonas nauphoetae]|uniref:Uncharacterized protein n=1 Tax=Blattamonas nauphoetae TaxID=2049346 RepID=A0ABQ9X8T3_9EUKA|nr:hypothetical protein BLNAU_17308 [Blattamonas nauphoetae]